MAEVGDLFADVLRPRWATGLHRVTAPHLKGVEEWLLHGSYAWNPAPAGSARLDISSTKELLTDALANEIARFSCATYESLIGALPSDQTDRSLGWSLVRYYYATFYAAHALLRLSGSSVTMLSSKTIATLNKIGGQYLGVSPQLVSGLHLVQIDQTDPSRVLISKIGGNSGGSHEEMWKQFLELLLYVENQLVLTQGQSQAAQSAVLVLAELRRHLCKQGKNNGAWLSSVRNDLNYKQRYGVWYPYAVTSKFAERLSHRMSRWTPGHSHGGSLDGSDGDLACFVDACNLTTSLLTTAHADIARRAAKARTSFVDRMPFRLLRLRKLVS